MMLSNGEVNKWGKVYDKVGRDTALGRLLIFTEQRYWLLTAMESDNGSGTISGLGASPEFWEMEIQKWRHSLETNSLINGMSDPVRSGIYNFRATIVAALGTAIRRMVPPSLRYSEIWCSGSVRRIELLGEIEDHGLQCACRLFNETLFELEEVINNLDPWIKWAVPGKGKVWIFVHGLCGPHVIRLIHGVPSSLEDISGFGHSSESPFTWGPVNGSVYLLSASILEDTINKRPSPDLWECFGDTVLSAFAPNQQFVLTAAEVEEWIEAPSRKKGWPKSWVRKFSN